ncbi:MAG: universal stress protein [Deltaproteobacteria bacterium]|jgi:nucleotide-binding universal stress UspA family protein|nr:universal stress protein [Deltaproteobacteria bacterium]
MIQIGKILCPIDFSKPSDTALEHAEEIARKFGAELVVAHVVEPVLYPVAYGLPPVAPVNYEESAKEAAEKALTPIVQAINERGVKARSLVESGTASMRICDLAEEEGFDLVVLATHGYTGLKHVLLGSTAERVVRHCTCPVLTVKGDAEG